MAVAACSGGHEGWKFNPDMFAGQGRLAIIRRAIEQRPINRASSVCYDVVSPMNRTPFRSRMNSSGGLCLPQRELDDNTRYNVTPGSTFTTKTTLSTFAYLDKVWYNSIIEMKQKTARHKSHVG